MNTDDWVGVAFLTALVLPWFVYAMRRAWRGKEPW